MNVVHVLNINNYFPELCEITMPLIKNYCKKINARLNIITERKYPTFPVTYEKMQVWEYGRQADWNILIDADMVVHPDAPNLTNMFTPDTVAFQSAFDADKQFAADEYFLRDGRKVGIAGGLVVTSKMTHDLWTPLEFPYVIAATKTKRQHILDEYCLSRNLAKFGMKFMGIAHFDKFIHIGVAADEEGQPVEESNEQKIIRAKRAVASFFY